MFVVGCISEPRFFRSVVLLLAAFAMVFTVEKSLAGGAPDPVSAVPPPRLSVPLTLAWGPSDDASVRGYAIYYGPTGQPTTNRVDAGTNLTVTILNLRANVEYRLYAVAYDDFGAESIPSNDLLLTLPVVSALKITPQSDGSVVIRGAAAPGSDGKLLYTSSLSPANWQTLFYFETDSTGHFLAKDVFAGQATQRFYRVVMTERQGGAGAAHSVAPAGRLD